MPPRIRNNTGRMMASSTAAAPRSVLAIFKPPPHEMCVRRRPGTPTWTASGVSDLRCDVLERRRQVRAERGDREDDHYGDQRNHQAVLDGGCAALGSEPTLDLGNELGHLFLSLVEE